VSLLVRILLRPLGYFAFVFGLLALSAAARLLGDKHELGFFADRLARAVWRYPEVTRRGVQVAWLLWALLFAVALSPLDPIATRWDEAALAVLGLAIFAHHYYGGRRVEH